MGRNLTLLLAFTTILSMNAFGEELKTKTLPKTPPIEVTQMNLETGGVTIKDPVLSPDSADQKARDKVVNANREDFDKTTTNHIESLYKCQKLGDAARIKECRDNAFKK